MIRPSTLIGAVLVALASFAAPAPQAHAASATELVPAATSRIDIAVNQGQLVRLGRPVNSVFIADPEIADVQVKSPMLVYVIGKASGTTTLYAVSAQDEVVLNTQVRVRFDAGRVEQAIHDLVPHSAIAVNAVADSLVLTGTVYSTGDGDDVRRIAGRFVKDPKQLVNKMKVDAPNQINLRVRVAEVSRDIVKQFGINWENVFNNGSFVFGIATGSAVLSAASVITNLQPGANGAARSFAQPTTSGSSTTGVGTIGATNFAGSFNTLQPSSTGQGTLNNVFGGGRAGNLNINSLIDALDNHGLVTVLAEPNLTAVSGEPANFLAGGEFPVPVPAGTGLVGIEWKKFGVSLNFVGTIASDDRISLHVMPEVSELSSTGSIVIDSISVPSLTTRRAETTVELATGQAFAIAGLLQNNVTQNINKFPWLGDVPVLGQLFRSEAFQRNETELVIIVTPYLVHPIATASAALAPTDGYIPSTDGQLVLHANEYTQRPAGTGQPNAGGTNLIGPVGFDLQ
ncbi:MAG TPA: type II and III secretion system protein family protein [Stellaceae bacterium]|nr:type II and III secretion system protein family protein [Stellaceae bacterium]